MARTPRLTAARLLAHMIAAMLLMTGFGPAAQGQGAGPDVGAQAPSFQATDQSGKNRSFDDLSGENGLLLLFFRSADW